jgi:chemotaxis family two-component system sensor histidine kinase/response regulator PixL
MNNLVGELAISRSSLLLQNDQMQRVIRALRDRFLRFQTLVSQLQAVSDQINRLDQIFTIPEPDRNIQPAETYSQLQNALAAIDSTYPAAIEFDMLEMDRYGETHTQLQAILEDLVQLEESVDDISLFARQSNQTLEQQQYKLTQLRDELVWARMLPLSEVLNRFPRILHDLSVDYEKPVQLKLTGVEVLIDRAILEKLYDPLLHLLRNAFDHGIEPAGLRPSTNKPPQGQIEICAFYQGNQTVIQVRDDGRGINLASIQERLQELGWLSATQIAALSPNQLINFIFEPGFSTAAQVSQLSGRGFGLDVVRSQLQALRGTVNVTSLTGKGTTFTLTLPLTLTITQLIVCLVNSLPIALPTESVADILVPQSDQLQQFQGNHWLNWREKTIPVYPLSDLLNYSCPVPEAVASQILSAFPAPKDWAAPIVVVQREEQVFGLAIDRVLTEQELVIKPFGTAAVPPRYLYGCTILGDGSPVPVIDAIALLESFPNSPSHRFDLPDSSIDPVGQQLDSVAATATRSGQASAEITPDTVTPDTVTPDTVTPDTVTPKPIAMPIGTARPRLNFRKTQTPTVLVVDDAIMLRRTLALFLEREGFRVLQAQDGQEAIDRLQQASVQLVVCDLEMPNMNGFEFLNFRRQTPHLAEIPVMILTSRSNEKHRWLSLKLGATAYFTKPYLEQEFLSALKALLPQTPVSSDSFDAKES